MNLTTTTKGLLPRLFFIGIVFIVSISVGVLLTQESAQTPFSPEVLSRATGIYEFSWSPDSTELAFVSAQGGTSEIWVVKTNSDAPRRITSDGLPKSDPQWSPDGGWISYVVEQQKGQGDIYGIAPDGSGSRRFIGTAADETEPRWSPDGKRLAFVSDAAGAPQLAVHDLEAGTSERLTEAPASDPRWSPDGRWIAFVSDPLPNDYRRDNEDIFVVPSTGGTARLLTPGTQRYRDYAPSWAPDSSRLVFASEENGFSNLYIVDIATTERTLLMSGDADQMQPRWSPDGETVAFVQSEDFEFHVWTLPAGGGRPVRISDRSGTNGGFSRHDSSPRGTLAWAPDGRQLAFTHSDPSRTSDIWLAGGVNRPTQLTNSMPQELRREARFTTPEVFRYRSVDGREISSLVFRPSREAGRSYPAVLVFRDSIEGQHALSWNPYIQFFVSNGYLVFAPNVRGASGKGKDYRQAAFGLGGEVDVRDAFIGLDRLSADGVIDPARVAVFGAGVGGYMVTAALARDGSRFQAAVAVQGIVDLVTAASYPGMAEWIRYLLGGDPMDVPDSYYERSLVNFVDALRTPIIFLYGENDPLAPFQQLAQFAVQAEVRGKWFDYRVFGAEPHGWHRWRPASTRVALEAIHALFDTHLLGRDRPIRLSRGS